MQLRKKGNLLYEHTRKEIKENLLATLKERNINYDKLELMIRKEEDQRDRKGIPGWERESCEVRIDTMWEYWRSLPL